MTKNGPTIYFEPKPQKKGNLKTILFTKKQLENCLKSKFIDSKSKTFNSHCEKSWNKMPGCNIGWGIGIGQGMDGEHTNCKKKKSIKHQGTHVHLHMYETERCLYQKRFLNFYEWMNEELKKS